MFPIRRPNPIERKENAIFFKGSIADFHIRNFCRHLYQAVKERGFQDIILDFSQCEKVFEAFMLPTLPIITNYRENRHIDFKLILPEEEKLSRLFQNANWAYYIAPNRYDKSDHEGGHLQALQYFDLPEQERLVGEVMELILRNIPNISRNELKAVEWSLGEIMNNVLQHAQSPVGGFVQATAHVQEKAIEFVVADGGIGIPKSLNIPRNPRKALQQAISEGITRDETDNQGNGLYGSYRVAVLSKGRFTVNSYQGRLEGDADIPMKLRQQKIPYEGTSVCCRIGFGNPDLLEEALQFSGQPHDPPFDYMERKYENDNEEGEMTLKIADDIGAVTSREGGKRVRNKLENLLNSADRVIVDFEGSHVITSSFADEVFGRLFVKLGPRHFTKRIDIRNADRTTDVLIDRAILQRMQTSQNGNGK